MKCGEDTELLERARRLCLAVRQLDLPVLLPAFSKVYDEVEEKAVDDEEDKLPLIAVKKRKKSLKQSGKMAKLEQEEKKKHEREIERVKQAQDRARARVARTNQLEHQQTLREAEQQQYDAVSAADECTEKIRKAQESRRRAHERIRMQRREKTPNTTLLSTEPRVRPNPTKLKDFHRKAIRRVQVSNQKIAHSDNVDAPDSSERSEDADADQKLMERRLRFETAARLKRMRQLAENQKRQEQEAFEQGLQKFKTNLREMDRVGKGLRKQPSQIDVVSFEVGSKILAINADLTVQPTAFDVEETEFRQETKVTAPMGMRSPSPIPEKLVLGPTNQDLDVSSDTGEPKSAARCRASIEVLSPRTAEPDIRRSKSRSRVPVWKQPPVPLQSTQCYSYKAIIPPAKYLPSES
ncbi:hypothetical protein P3T76_001654 [Phytophthora citrophthora]|uniref:Uncharacterized protein n=1 Tax=Phytophthora citrophthora TaxID=4793 RepID=A0AAD9GZQ4_9STRA|nr:hypothetical protein P3T76_001654 [Phytophthora citrophthora]